MTTTTMNNPVPIPNDTEKAFKILRLNEEYQEFDRKRKAINTAFGRELKRIKSEIADVLAGESTEKELIANVGDIHDTDRIKIRTSK